MKQRYSKIVTPSGDTEWIPDPNGTHVGDDRGNCIEMTPVVRRPDNAELTAMDMYSAETDPSDDLVRQAKEAHRHKPDTTGEES